MGRPLGVTIIGIFALFSALVGIVAGGGSMLNLKIPMITEVTQQSGAVASLVVGLGWLLLALGFFNGWGWARMLGVIWSFLGIVIAIFVVATHLNAVSTVVVPAIASAIGPVIIFWYLRRPDVAAFFKR